MKKSRLLNYMIGSALLFCTPFIYADLTFGVHPFKPATKLVDAFTPICRYLSEKLGEKVTLIISKDYQSHVDAIGKGELDIAYLGPVSYVKLVEQYGERPLLGRQRIGQQPVFHGKIFVRADSKIQTLKELQGKRFAFGESHSTMSHLIPRYMLDEAGITVDRLAAYEFVGDHVNVALAVLAGKFDAGAVKEDVYYSYEKRGLRAIATSEPISDHVLVASNRLPEKKFQQIRNILLHMNTDAAGREALQAMTPGVNALVTVQDKDYDTLRKALNKMKEQGIAY